MEVIQNQLKIKIRRASIKDFEAVKRIEYLSFKNPYSDYYLKRLLNGNLADLSFIAELNNQPVGYVIARREFKENEIIGHVIAIAVHPDFRGRGIGKRLMETVLQEFKKLGVKKVYLEVRVNNLPALRLYEKLGFKIVEYIPSYYRDGEDAFVLEKIL